MNEITNNNITILNTRPSALQQYTHDAFVKQGFKVIDFPCIEIADIENIDTVHTQLNQLIAQDVIVFTSQYAVRHTFKISPQLILPKRATVIAVGTKTSQVLEQNYSGDIWTPEQQNSEGVLDLIEGLAKCNAIKLITAENGRDTIKGYALNNKINFEQINVYHRQIPTVNKQTIPEITQTSSLYILATSVTTLNNVKVLTQNSWPKLLKQTVVCASARIQKIAIKLGFDNTLNLKTANPELIAKELKTIIKDL